MIQCIYIYVLLYYIMLYCIILLYYIYVLLNSIFISILYKIISFGKNVFNIAVRQPFSKLDRNRRKLYNSITIGSIGTIFIVLVHFR